jgi:hypothetical protein
MSFVAGVVTGILVCVGLAMLERHYGVPPEHWIHQFERRVHRARRRALRRKS